MLQKKITVKISKVIKTKPEKTAQGNPEDLIPKVVNNVPSCPGGYDFKIFSKFVLDGIIYTVKSRYVDSNTTQVKIWSQETGEEVIPVDSLKRHIKSDPNFKVL